MKKLPFFIFILFLLGIAILFEWLFIMPNVNCEKKMSVKIPTGSGYDEVLRILHENHVLKNEFTFRIVSKMKHYETQVHPGYYVFAQNMNNRQIANMLRMGWQTPVTLVIYNIRTKEEFAGLAGRTLELDSNEVLAKLNNPAFCAKLGSDTNKILTRFIMDNYEYYWNAPLEKFFDKLKEGYQKFWDSTRLTKAEVLHLAPSEVNILASIVEKEVIRDKELPTVAGVYLNRLKIGMPLQADPCLLFATRDFDAHRVNSTHKEFDSPYNTYKYTGLPPGPICIPRKKSIDAVLNYEDHNNLYFCANPDMSGFSIFSKSYEEQMKTASEYQKKLNAMNVH